MYRLVKKSLVNRIAPSDACMHYSLPWAQFEKMERAALIFSAALYEAS